MLVVQTYSPGLRYGPDEKNILMFVSNQVAMAIERKRTEADLRRSEQKNRAILSAMPDLMFLLDQDGVFLDYKAEKDSDLLASPEMFLGRKVGDVLPPALADLTMKNIAHVCRPGAAGFEYEVDDQRQLQYEEARCALCGSDEVLVVIRNITEKRRLEQQVLQAQKMESLGTLAGGIAHDFNNILAGILGYASFLKSQAQPRPRFFQIRGYHRAQRHPRRRPDLQAPGFHPRRQGEFQAAEYQQTGPAKPWRSSAIRSTSPSASKPSWMNRCPPSRAMPARSSRC